MKSDTTQAVKTVSFRPKCIELNQRIERLATLDRRGVSQMALVLVEDAVALREKQLGLPPISEDPPLKQASGH